MRFGLFGGARTNPGEQASDSRIYTDYIDYICEAETLGFHSVFLVEHHFTGFGQVSATLSFLTYLAAKTTTLRLGIPVQEAEERYQETVAFLRKAWTTPGRFSHHGKYWQFEDVVIEPAPVQKPHPPFWAGAASPNSIAHAAEQGHNLL